MADEFKFIKPPRVNLSGDIEAAKRYIPLGEKQLGQLTGFMEYQKLQQMNRTVEYDMGSGNVVVSCLSSFGNTTINIHVPPQEQGGEELAELRVSWCWCNCCFASGIIKEVIGDYGDPVGSFEDTYPDDLVDTDLNIQNYDGIRYKVVVCQKQKDYGFENNEQYSRDEFICIPSDFAEYRADDEVIVWLSKYWSGEGDSATADTSQCRSCDDDP